MSEWVTPALAFLGALVGAGVPAWVAVRGQRQAARSEWRERFDRALENLTSHEVAQQLIGDELLADLINSDLGSEGDRDLARRIGRLSLRQAVTGLSVDSATDSSDNGEDDHDLEGEQ